MIHDFRDDHRPHARIGVVGAEGVRALQHELLLLPGCSHSGRKQRRSARHQNQTRGRSPVRFVLASPEKRYTSIAGRTEVEAIRPHAELVAGEERVAPRRNERAVGNTILVGHLRIVGEKPAAHVHPVGGRIEQVRCVSICGGSVCVRASMTRMGGIDGGVGIRCARRTVQGAAGPPTRFVNSKP